MCYIFDLSTKNFDLVLQSLYRWNKMNTFSHVPPGFRFHPTEEELVDYYLRKKVASKKIDLDVIKDVDLYKIEPWDLQGEHSYIYFSRSDHAMEIIWICYYLLSIWSYAKLN